MVHVQQCITQYFISFPSPPASQMALHMKDHIPITYNFFFYLISYSLGVGDGMLAEQT